MFLQPIVVCVAIQATHYAGPSYLLTCTSCCLTCMPSLSVRVSRCHGSISRAASHCQDVQFLPHADPARRPRATPGISLPQTNYRQLINFITNFSIHFLAFPVNPLMPQQVLSVLYTFTIRRMVFSLQSSLHAGIMERESLRNGSMNIVIIHSHP